jgi:hypothetical protein
LRGLTETGVRAMLVLMIMFIGSLGLWLGTPLLWLWIGSQVQGRTDSLGAALAVMLVGAPVTIALLATLLGKLSITYRQNRLARGLGDPGHLVLESVLVVSAAVCLVGFLAWFLLFAGASPVPLGIQL